MAIDQSKLDELRASFHDETSLLPVIVQDDESNEVLMLAYLSRASLNQSIDTGRATYYSRSRNEIWVKGETSGHRQWIRSISFDCDSDAILFSVHQEGVACHTGERSCFHHRVL